MNREDGRLPYRQAIRLVHEFQVAAGSVALVAVDRDLDRAVLLKMLHRQALRRPDDLTVSMNGMASSLQRPVETVRRSALELADAGLCERIARGVRRRPDFLAHPTIVASARELRMLFDYMLDGFELTGFTLPAGGRDAGEAATVAAALDIYLSVFELNELRFTAPMRLYLLGQIAVMNAAALTRDSVLGPAYGLDATVPPDALRRPAPLREIAARDGFPYTTIWRHAKAAAADGLIRRVRGGYLLSQVYMDNADTTKRRRERIRYVRRVLIDLAEGRYRPGERIVATT